MKLIPLHKLYEQMNTKRIYLAGVEMPVVTDSQDNTKNISSKSATMDHVNHQGKYSFNVKQDGLHYKFKTITEKVSDLLQADIAKVTILRQDANSQNKIQQTLHPDDILQRGDIITKVFISDEKIVTKYKLAEKRVILTQAHDSFSTATSTATAFTKISTAVLAENLHAPAKFQELITVLDLDEIDPKDSSLRRSNTYLTYRVVETLANTMNISEKYLAQRLYQIYKVGLATLNQGVQIANDKQPQNFAELKQLTGDKEVMKTGIDMVARFSSMDNFLNGLDLPLTEASLDAITKNKILVKIKELKSSNKKEGKISINNQERIIKIDREFATISTNPPLEIASKNLPYTAEPFIKLDIKNLRIRNLPIPYYEVLFHNIPSQAKASKLLDSFTANEFVNILAKVDDNLANMISITPEGTKQETVDNLRQRVESLPMQGTNKQKLSMLATNALIQQTIDLTHQEPISLSAGISLFGAGIGVNINAIKYDAERNQEFLVAQQDSAKFLLHKFDLNKGDDGIIHIDEDKIFQTDKKAYKQIIKIQASESVVLQKGHDLKNLQAAGVDNIDIKVNNSIDTRTIIISMSKNGETIVKGQHETAIKNYNAERIAGHTNNIHRGNETDFTNALDSDITKMTNVQKTISDLAGREKRENSTAVDNILNPAVTNVMLLVSGYHLSRLQGNKTLENRQNNRIKDFLKAYDTRDLNRLKTFFTNEIIGNQIFLEKVVRDSNTADVNRQQLIAQFNQLPNSQLHTLFDRMHDSTRVDIFKSAKNFSVYKNNPINPISERYHDGAQSGKVVAGLIERLGADSADVSKKVHNLLGDTIKNIEDIHETEIATEITDSVSVFNSSRYSKGWVQENSGYEGRSLAAIKGTIVPLDNLAPAAKAIIITNIIAKNTYIQTLVQHSDVSIKELALSAVSPNSPVRININDSKTGLTGSYKLSATNIRTFMISQSGDTSFAANINLVRDTVAGNPPAISTVVNGMQVTASTASSEEIKNPISIPIPFFGVSILDSGANVIITNSGANVNGTGGGGTGGGGI